MKKGYLLVISVLLSCCFSLVHAQRVVTLSGEYRYVVPGDIPLSRAKQIAIDRARNEAIANEFGQVVSQSTSTVIHTTGNESSVSTDSYSSSESMAIWLNDTKEPEVKVIYENDVMVITAYVWGRARELKEAEVELKMQIVCDGIETERFKSDETVAIRFKSPVSGFASVFFRDDAAGMIYCMMPYENEDGTAREVKSNKEYIYLSSDDPIYPYREQTILVTDKVVEYDTFILVFSKRDFAMPASDAGEFVPELSVEDFHKWLRRNRINDETMQIVEKSIQITKN